MINKQLLLNMDRNDLTNLTCDILQSLTLKIASENNYKIPDGFELTSLTKKVKWKFDVRINEEMTEEGKKDFDDFCNSKRIDEAAKRFYGSTPI